MEENIELETFFVYKPVGTLDWQVLISGSCIDSLPTCEFVAKVLARNEKEAVAQAQKLWEPMDDRLKLFINITGSLIASGAPLINIESTAWATLNRIMSFYQQESKNDFKGRTS